MSRLEAGRGDPGYHAAVDPVALGRSVAALVGVHLSDTSDQDAVAVALQRLEEIEDCWFVAGDESFLIKVRVADVTALERTLSRLRQDPRRGPDPHHRRAVDEVGGPGRGGLSDR